MKNSGGQNNNNNKVRHHKKTQLKLGHCREPPRAWYLKSKYDNMAVSRPNGRKSTTKKCTYFLQLLKFNRAKYPYFLDFLVFNYLSEIGHFIEIGRGRPKMNFCKNVVEYILLMYKKKPLEWLKLREKMHFIKWK